MARSTVPRLARCLGALLLAAPLAVGVPGAHPAGVTPRPCERVAVSPAFTTDGTAFCIGRDSDLVVGGSTDGFLLFVTSDRGRSWRQAPAVGLPAAAFDDVLQMIVSPRFATDRALVVQTLGHGAFVSVDSGGTFTPLYPLDKPWLTPVVVGVADGAQPAVERTVLLGASSSVSGTGSVLIDLSTRLVTPVAGPPVPPAAYAVSPAYARDGRALALVDRAGPGGTRVEAYSCDREFSCPTRVGSFPKDHRLDRAWFLSASVVVVTVRHKESQAPRAFLSRDGGRSFAAHVSLQRLLDAQTVPRQSAPEVELATTPSGRTTWLRIYGPPRTRPPASRLYRSDDLGRSWRLVSYARIAREGGGPRGALPEFRVPPRWITPRVHLQATDDGYVFFGGLSPAGWDVACSSDGGRRWAPFCR